MENFDFEHCIYIYAHINKINHKVYIGQTVQKPKYRWNNGNGYKGCVLLYRAIEKYGWNNFDHEILCIVPESFADTMEKYFIKKYQSNDPKYGYNLDSGGQKSKHLSEFTKQKLSLFNKGKHLSAETRKKMSAVKHISCNTPEWKQYVSESKKGHNVTAETRKKMSKTQKGHMTSLEARKKMSESHKGKSLSLEWRKHIGEARRGRVLSLEWKKHISEGRKNKKPVVCLETGVIYESIAETARQLNLDHRNIGACCRHKYGYRSAGGLHFEFYTILDD